MKPEIDREITNQSQPILHCFLCKTVREDLICPFTKEAQLHMAFIAVSYARL